MLNTIGQLVSFSFERSKRKSIGITIKPDGSVFVKAPLRMPEYKVWEFVNSKRKWIVTKHFELKEKFKEPSYKENDSFKVLGKEYKLQIQRMSIKRAKLELQDENLVAYIPSGLTNVQEEEIVQKSYDNLIKNVAIKIIPEEMEKVSNIVGLKPKELKIKNFKRAWGNCSSKKVISINKDLCKFGVAQIDYVCLHEICHLKHMNHSKAFWSMVGMYMPDYKNIQKSLK